MICISISKAHQESMSLIKYLFIFFAFLVFGATKNGFIEWGNDEKFWEKEIIYLESLHAHRYVNFNYVKNSFFVTSGCYSGGWLSCIESDHKVLRVLNWKLWKLHWSCSTKHFTKAFIEDSSTGEASKSKALFCRKSKSLDSSSGRLHFGL